MVVAGLVPNLAWMRISKRTGYKFADFCSDYSALRPIQALFEAEDFVTKPGYDGSAPLDPAFNGCRHRHGA